MARVYVGTYAKYNNGSIKGDWIDLEDYPDKESFLERCKELHSDEDDPEFMFQDYEGFPSEFYGESGLDDRLWDWLELDEGDRELLAVYVEHVNQSGDIDEARDAFAGKANSKADWAAEYWEETGLLAQIPDELQQYIDYESYARDCEAGGSHVFVRHDGDLWVFRNQ